MPPANPQQPATVIVASAGGRLVAKATEDFVRAVAATQGAQTVVRDVRPLAPGDAIGVGVFMFMIVCTICGYLAVTLLFTVTPALPPVRRYFGGLGVGADLLRLLAWTGVIVALLLLPVSRKLARQRGHSVFTEAFHRSAPRLARQP